jgi:hypothetical protein
MIFAELAALIVVLCLIGGSFLLVNNRLKAHNEERDIKLLEGFMREAEVDGDDEAVRMLRHVIINKLGKDQLRSSKT